MSATDAAKAIEKQKRRASKAASIGLSKVKNN
jgi:hypothetical protein